MEELILERVDTWLKEWLYAVYEISTEDGEFIGYLAIDESEDDAVVLVDGRGRELDDKESIELYRKLEEEFPEELDIVYEIANNDDDD